MASTNTDTDSEKWNEISQLSESSLLPKLDFLYAYDTDDEAQNTEDQKRITSTRIHAGQTLVGICALLKSMHSEHSEVRGQDQDIQERKSFSALISAQRRKQLVALLSLLGEQYSSPESVSHSCSNKPWLAMANGKIVEEIILELHAVFNLTTPAAPESVTPTPTATKLSQLFEKDFKTGVNPDKTIFGQLLQAFRLKLVGQNEIWQFHPAAKASFHWILIQVRYPYLSDFIAGTLQPTLNFCADFQTRNLSDALDCFEHVVDNVNKAELCGSGAGSWCDVIHKSLIKMLDSAKEGEVVNKLLPLILKTLKLLEKDPHNQSAQFTLYDEVLERILHTIEFGGAEINTKVIWLQQLGLYLDCMGSAILHWLVRIVRIMDENTTCNDPQRWVEVLKCLKTCILNSWMKPQSEAFAEIILKIVYNISVFDIDCDAGIREEIVTQSTECLDLLSCNSDYDPVHKQLVMLTGTTRDFSGTGHLRTSDQFQPKFNDVWNRISTDLNLLTR